MSKVNSGPLGIPTVGLWVVGAAILLLLGLLALPSSDESVAVCTLERHMIRPVVTEHGEVVASTVRSISAKTGGVIIWMIPEGTFAKSGTEVLRIDPSSTEREITLHAESGEIRQQELTDARAVQTRIEKQKTEYVAMAKLDLERAQNTLDDLTSRPRPADLKRAKNRLESTEIKRDAAKKDHDNHQRWLKSGTVNALSAQRKAQAYFSALVQYRKADDDLKEMKVPDELAIAGVRQSVEMAKLDLDNTRKDWEGRALASEADVDLRVAEVKRFESKMVDLKSKLSNCSVKMPKGVQGKVAYVNTWKGNSEDMTPIQLGEQAREGSLLMKIADVSTLKVQVAVNEVDVDRVKKGLPVRIEMEALPGVVIEGTVSSVYAIADDKNNIRGSLAMEHSGTAGTAAVRVTVSLDLSGRPQLQEKVQLGFTARVDIIMPPSDPVPVLPQSAVGRDDKGDHCFVLSGGEPIRHTLRLGKADARWVEILEGLSTDDRVVRHWLDVFSMWNEVAP